LSWANGRVPTPYGPIEVKWEKQDESFVLEFSVPYGTRGSTGVPFAGSAGSLMLNGHSVKTAATAFSTEGNTGRTGYTYVRDLAPGAYRIVASEISR
jgi:alpha-L-rhamnosidase